MTSVPRNCASMGTRSSSRDSREDPAILLAQLGELVTREALQKELWPEDTFVDFGFWPELRHKETARSPRGLEGELTIYRNFAAAWVQVHRAGRGGRVRSSRPVNVLRATRAGSGWPAIEPHRLPVMVGAVLALLFISSGCTARDGASARGRNSAASRLGNNPFNPRRAAA